MLSVQEGLSRIKEERRTKGESADPSSTADLVLEYAAMDSSSSGNPYVPLTSQNIRDELDRAAAEMAQQDFSTDKLKKETPEHFEESDYGSCSDEIEAKDQALEPNGGPMSYKLKSGYISDWLSTDDHNLEGLLEKRGKGVPRPREEVPKS